MNTIRIIALSLMLAAGGAVAKGKNKDSQNAPPGALSKADKPKSCADQCKMIEKVLTDPCKKPGTRKPVQQMCMEQADQMVDACNGSCKDKGRIDKQYMMERLKPPAGYKAGQEDGKGGDSHGDGDAH